MKNTSTTILALAGLLAASTASADVLSNYTFAGSAPASSDTELNSVAGSFSTAFNGGALRYSTSAGNGQPSVFAFGSDTVGSDEATTVAGNNYWNFTVTAETGYVLNLSSLTFQTETSNGVTANFFVRASADGFATTFAEGIFVQGPDTSVNWTTRSIGLTSLPSYQGMTTVTFRIYAWDNNTSSSTAGARLDNIVLNGTVTAVPEPSSFAALAGLAAVGFAATRRRRRA